MGDWRKSSYSNANGGDCIEIADEDGAILVRDTKNRAGAMLSVDADAWERFTAAIRQTT
jgi:Domain of unknown function (DUF397)